MTEPPLIRFVVCVGDVCDREGRGSELHERLTEAIGAAFAAETGAGRIASTRRSCLRHCSHGVPMLRIEPSGDVYADPSSDDMMALVDATLAEDRGRSRA